MLEKIFFGLTVAALAVAALVMAIVIVITVVNTWHLHSVSLNIQLAFIMLVTYVGIFGLVGVMLYEMRPGVK